MPCIHFRRRKTAQSHGLTELPHLAELLEGILTDSSAISKTKVTMGTVQTTRAPQHVDLSVLKTNSWPIYSVSNHSVTKHCQQLGPVKNVLSLRLSMG